uniref:YbjN domain-containing protein n=1 Tax=Pseudomonas phage Cygsa01 TaxID=3138529 RepID=A0AAU6W3V6_9VIRU
MSLENQAAPAAEATEAKAPAYVIPEKFQQKVADILEYTKAAFNVPFEFTLQNGEGDAFWLLGPYGTFVIALGVSPSGKLEELIDVISVSLEAETHFAAVTSHAFATKFGLIYMDPHCPGFGAQEGQLLFGPAAYDAKKVIDEARLRAKVVELAGEAARQEVKANEPTLAEKIMGGPKELIDAHGRVLK